MIMLKQNALLPLAIALLSPFSAYAGDVDKTLPWTEGGDIDISITAGQVEIRGWNKNEVKLSGDFSGDDDRLTFKRSGKNIKLDLEDESRGWWGNNSGGNVDFTLFAPFESDIDVDGTSLSIEISKINGDIEINSISGRIRYSGQSKRLDVETVSGDIDVEDAGGKIRLRTVSGDIGADVSAYTFDAKTVSGDIDGQIGNVESANLLSVSGDVKVELALADDGRVDGQTVSGNLDLSFDNKVNADFELNTGPGGDISNRLSDDRAKDDSRWGEEIRFTTGNGSGTVDLETMSGTIKVR